MAIMLLQKAESNLMQVNAQIAEVQAGADSLGDLSLMQGSGLSTLDSLKNRLLGLTFNNLGCVCKQSKDFKQALFYLKKALVYESRLEEQEEEHFLEQDHDYADTETLKFIQCNSAGTILNICAILSKLNRHKDAHDYAQ